MAKASLKNKSTDPQKEMSAMARLMASHTGKFVTLKKGETVKAVLTKLSPNEILVDTGAKTDALVLERDKRIANTIISTFTVGETVEVYVLNPESENGQPIVSLRKYLGDLAWGRLEELQKSGEQVEVTVKDSTKAGFLVDTAFGVSGFLPQSHITYTTEGLHGGQQTHAMVLEINRKDNKVIFSQKKTMSAEEFTKLSKKFKVGDKVKVTVTNVTPFGVFVALPVDKEDSGLEGFIHISETSWEKVQDIAGMFSAGDKIEAVLSKFDTDTKRVSLSIKRMTDDPFETLMEKYPVDKKVTGTVSRIADGDVIITLDEDGEVEGVLRKDKILPDVTYTQGQSVAVIIADYDKRRHQIILTPVLLEKPMGYR